MTTTVTPRLLVASKYIEGVQTTQYTATGVKTIIDKCTVTNTTLAAAAFSINMVLAAGAVGNDNLVVINRILAPFETYTCPEIVGHMLDINGYLSAIAGASPALVLRVSGREVLETV